MIDLPEIRLDYFMAAANAAYYAKKDPFADFITAPEISQMFGEMIAVWIINVMHTMPYKSVAFIEAGAGRGTLMADILRIIRQVAPDYYRKCSLYLIETSSRLRQIQKQTLKDYHECSVQWLDSVENLPDLPIIFIANEFLDALPIRQFVYKGKEQWTEHYVYQNKVIEKSINQLPDAPIFKRPIAVEDIVEVCEVGQGVIRKVTTHIGHYGGIALFIDYGYAQNVWGDTLQAIANREKVSPFGTIGEADITAHIDFLALKEIALKYGGKVQGILTQGEFLKRLGILLRANQLMGKATNFEKQEIALALRRLIDPEEMGDLFKVMVISHFSLPLSSIFESDGSITI